MFGITETRRVLAEMKRAKASGEAGVCFNEAAYRAGFRRCPCGCSRAPANREAATDNALWADHAPFLIRAIGAADKAWDAVIARFGSLQPTVTAR